MQSTGPSRPRGLLLASSATVVVLLLVTTAGLGAAAQETPTNNTTIQHERPSEVSADGDTEQVKRWLERRLARQLGESAVNISQGQYERGRAVIGDAYTSRLDQYVSVDGETETESDDRTGQTYREAQQNQREYANATQAYRETYERYERARRNGNTTGARRAARELETLSERVQTLNASLQREYVTLTNRTAVDTDQSRDALATTSSAIASQQATVRDETFVAATLTARTNASTVSFTSPAMVSGRLRLANGTVLSNVAGRIVVADRSYAVTTDSEGRFAVQYRPVSLPANATSVPVRFVPTATSVYLGASDDISVSVTQRSPRLELTTTPTSGGYGDSLTTTAVATVDGRPVPSLPIRARIGETVVSGRTDTDGRVTLSPRVPAALAPGERPLRVAHTRSTVAVGQNATATTVRITETGTTLTVDATADGDLRVRGRLRTADGDPVGAQPLRVVFGETSRSVETNATGWYQLTVSNVSALDGAGDALAVTARFNGSGTNLRDSRAETSVTRQSTPQEGDSLMPLIVGSLVVGVLVVAGVVGLSRRQPEGGTDETDETATPSPASTPADTPSPAQSVPWLDRAQSALAAGDDERAIVAAYAAVRRFFEREASLPSTLTHREFVAAGTDALSGDDIEALSTVATTYERSTFLDERDSTAATAAVEAAAALLPEPADAAATLAPASAAAGVDLTPALPPGSDAGVDTPPALPPRPDEPTAATGSVAEPAAAADPSSVAAADDAEDGGKLTTATATDAVEEADNSHADDAVDTSNADEMVDSPDEHSGGTPNAAEDGDSSADDDAETNATAAAVAVDPASLTPAERETLRAIQRHPGATQRAIAGELDVSASTVCRRVNGIEGFEWSERADFVTALFDTPTSPSDAAADTAEQ